MRSQRSPPAPGGVAWEPGAGPEASRKREPVAAQAGVTGRAGSRERAGAVRHGSLTQSPDAEKMAAGVEAEAEVAATEPKMEEESGAPCVPSGNGAPGPKG